MNQLICKQVSDRKPEIVILIIIIIIKCWLWLNWDSLCLQLGHWAFILGGAEQADVGVLAHCGERMRVTPMGSSELSGPNEHT